MEKDLLNLDEFEVISLEENDNGDYLFNVKPKTPSQVCPECGSISVVNNGTYNRLARDLNCYEHKVGINIMGNRHKCRDCGITFCDTYKSIETNAKVTVRLKTKICELATKRPFLQIAEEYGITMPTVKRIFMEYVEVEEKKRVLYSPTVLGIDEAHLNKTMRGVIIDVNARRVIELLDTRSKNRVMEYFNSLPNSDKIKVVTMDMWRPYAEAAYECLPNAKIVIDRFHVVKALNVALDNVRKSITSEIGGRGSRANVRYLRYLLLSNFEDLNPNQAQELDDMLDRNETLNKAYTLKEGLRNIYLCKTRKEAENLYKSWVKEIPDDLSEFQTVRKMVDNWHTEIFNFFDCERCTNGITECLNNLIKIIERYGRCYNFEVLRAKIMFTTSATKSAKYAFKKPTAKRTSEPTNDSYGFSIGGMMPDITYQEYKESKVLEIGSGVDMDELAAILDMGKF